MSGRVVGWRWCGLDWAAGDEMRSRLNVDDVMMMWWWWCGGVRAAQAMKSQEDEMNKMVAAGQSAQAQEEKKAETDARRKQIVGQILTPDARERLSRIELVNPEKARAVEESLIRLASSGQLAEKVNGERLKSMLEQAATTKKETKIKFQRKKRNDEESDEEFDLV